jgi:hypothetical protein
LTKCLSNMRCLYPRYFFLAHLGDCRLLTRFVTTGAILLKHGVLPLQSPGHFVSFSWFDLPVLSGLQAAILNIRLLPMVVGRMTNFCRRCI